MTVGEPAALSRPLGRGEDSLDARLSGRPGYRHYALGLMTALYTLNLTDRALVSLLIEPIKNELRLNDTEIGFLTGIAFALFYATLGVPIARWADRGSRSMIAAMAIALWSMTVMATVFVTSFVQLALARMAAAVGEAGCKPPTYSLVGDYFPKPRERTTAMSVYWLGGPIAALVSFIAGGWLNELFGWRMAFVIMGLPGIVLALLTALTLHEPRRRVPVSEGAHPHRGSIWNVLQLLWRNRACRHLTIALILSFMMLFGLAPWSTVFMIRTHGIGTRELGLWLGLIFGLGGAFGVLVGGYLANHWFGDNERSQMRFSAAAIALTLPFYLAFLLIGNKHVALAMLAPWYVVTNCFVAPTYALLQRLVPDDMRATAMAVVMLLYNLLGMGAGPQIVGLLSDGLAPSLGPASLQYALIAISLLAFLSALHFWKAGEYVEVELASSGSRR